MTKQRVPQSSSRLNTNLWQTMPDSLWRQHTQEPVELEPVLRAYNLQHDLLSTAFSHDETPQEIVIELGKKHGYNLQTTRGNFKFMRDLGIPREERRTLFTAHLTESAPMAALHEFIYSGTRMKCAENGYR